ncbi:hypothetical protein P7K49_011966, partial [Saguinus oedipus]
GPQQLWLESGGVLLPPSTRFSRDSGEGRGPAGRAKDQQDSQHILSTPGPLESIFALEAALR